MLGPGRQRAHHGRQPRRARRRRPMEHRAGLVRAAAGPRRCHLRRPDGTHARIAAPRGLPAATARAARVREISGIGFPGAPYEHTFFVADTEATGPMKPGELNVYLWRDGFHLFFPMRGKDRWRVIGILPKTVPRQGRRDIREPRPVDPPGSRRRPRLQVVQLVLDLPHPSPGGGAVPRPALLPARRRGARPQSRWAGRA